MLELLFNQGSVALKEIKDSIFSQTFDLEATNPDQNWPVDCGGIDIVAIDTSGSMENTDYRPTRLAGAKEAVTGFLNTCAQQRPKQMIGIVEFSTRARVASSPMTVGERLSDLSYSLSRLSTHSSTNMGGGLKLAAKEIVRFRSPRRPRVLILTDGHSNDGPNPLRVAQEVKSRGVQIDIIGIGGSRSDVNEPELKQMASVVNGETRYWFIESVGELVKKFETLALREVR